MDIAYFLIIGLVLLVLFFIFEFNLIKTLKNKVLQSRSGIDVALNKRFELIPNLVECVKGYCKYEEKVLTEITAERENFYNTNSLKDGMNLNEKCNKVLGLCEKYPDLKASQNFLDLQATLERIENELSAARRLYNGDVTLYNTKIQTFPGNIIANFLEAETQELFEVEESKKQNINVDL